MKKFVALTAALALAAPVSFTLPSTALAAQGTGNLYAKVCQAYATYYGVSQGNCVAFLNAGGTPNANTFCHAFQAWDPGLFAYYFPTFGACTAAFNK